ncbi:MAG: hypothetical protein Q9200_006945 [Gallowayella weberi]
MAFNLLLELPLELRELIYAFYLSSITVRPPRCTIPPLLLASRQLREEAMPLYHANATFYFDSAIDFLDCLISIKHSLLCKLRHISVVGGAIKIKHAIPGSRMHVGNSTPSTPSSHSSQDSTTTPRTNPPT